MEADVLPSIAAPTTRIHLRVACLCGVVLFLEGYDIAAAGYAIPALVDAWKVPPATFTRVLTSGNVGMLLGSVCAGWLGDRLGRKPVLLGCIVVFGVFSLLSALVGSPSHLEALRFFTGLGLGGGLPTAVALASDFAPGTSQARVLILMIVGVPIGFSLGGFLASYLVYFYGWPAIFVAGGMLPLVVALLLSLWLPERAMSRSARHHFSPALLFQDQLAPSTLLLWTINALNLLGIYFILQWTPAILHSTGVSSSRAILGTTMYGLGTIASPFVVAHMVDRFGVEPTLASGLTFGACCVLAIGLFYPGFWIIAVLLCGVGIGGGCQAGIVSLSALAYPSPIRSTGAGWALGAGRLGTISGPLLAGFLLALGFTAPELYVLAAIPAFSTALLMAILGQMRRKP